MLLDVLMACGVIHQLIIPGVTLQYCLARTIDKGVACMWSLCLLIGPDHRTFMIIWNARGAEMVI